MQSTVPHLRKQGVLNCCEMNSGLMTSCVCVCICYFPTGIQDFILLLIKAVSMTRRNFTRQVLFLLHFSFCLTHSFLAGHSEVTNSIVWLPGQINCLVAGMQSRFLKIFDIRGQSYSCTFTPVLVFMPSSPQTAM